MNIFVIDDHPLMREALVMLVRRLNVAANVVEIERLGLVEQAVKKHGNPVLICLDLKLPDATDTSGVRDMKARFPGIPLAVLSASPAAEWDDACIEAGADVYIEKSAGASEITAALRALLAEDSGYEETSTPTDNKLSKRQKQLIVMLDRGLSNRDIATELGISEHTVKVHLWRLFRRLDVKSRTQTLHYARTHGLLGN